MAQSDWSLCECGHMCIAGVEDVYSKPRHMPQCKMETKAYKRVYGDSKRQLEMFFSGLYLSMGKKIFQFYLWLTGRERERAGHGVYRYLKTAWAL